MKITSSDKQKIVNESEKNKAPRSCRCRRGGCSRCLALRLATNEPTLCLYPQLEENPF
jgi:hypothetical protein